MKIIKTASYEDEKCPHCGQVRRGKGTKPHDFSNCPKNPKNKKKQVSPFPR